MAGGGEGAEGFKAGGGYRSAEFSLAITIKLWHRFTLLGAKVHELSAALLSKITLAAIVFGLAFLDQDYSPFESTHSAISAILILALIFFGDIVLRWLGRR